MRRRSLAVAVIGLAAVAVLLIFVLAALQVIPLLPVKAEPRTITVPDEYSDIQEAIDHANDGDTVFVKAGTYIVYGFRTADARLLVDKSINLIGENSMVNIKPDPESPRHYSTSLVGVSADKVTISGFTISGEETSLSVGGSWCTVTGNTVGNYLSGSFGVGGSWNTVTGNNVFGGVVLSGDNNVFSQNNVQGNRLYVKGSNHLISGNSVSRSPGEGILLQCQYVTVRDNNIFENGLTSGNQYYYGGIAFDNGPLYIYRNNITDNPHFGIGLNPGSNAAIFNNNILRNGMGIRLVMQNQTDIQVTDNEVYYNNFVDNGENAAVVQIRVNDFVSGVDGADVVSWDNGLVGNYWSDYQGQGTYIIDENNVDYHPLTEQVDISTTAPGSSPEPEKFLVAIAVIAAVIIISAAIIMYLWRK